MECVIHFHVILQCEILNVSNVLYGKMYFKYSLKKTC